MTQRSFIRVGDGDRRPYEVQMMLASRGQPRDDEQPVPGTSVTDLDPASVTSLITRLRATRPHAFADLDDQAALRRS